MKIAIIPARGGSKRIRGKNIRSFAGSPIIAHSIRVAQQSLLFDTIIVSTDSEEIADVARAFGASVPFLRPAELATDHASTESVIKHALLWAAEHGAAADYFCCIYPTAPLMRCEDLTRGYEVLCTNDATTSFAVTTYPYTIFRSLTINADGRLQMLWPENNDKRSQEFPEAYHDAGQFYWGHSRRFLQEMQLFSADAVPVVIPRLFAQDIDTLEDWESAELMYRLLRSGTSSDVAS